jgi:hypothetical protein
LKSRVGGSTLVEISDFLVNLRAVAGSPYAFAAYVAVAAAWTYTTIARHRLEKIAQLFKDLPPDDRTKVIMREYSTAPRSGLSADQWIKSRQHMLMFVGFLSLLICATLIVIVALVVTASRDGSGVVLEEMTRLKDAMRRQDQELLEIKRDFSAYKASAGGLQTSLSSFDPAQPKPAPAKRELIAGIQDVGFDHGFDDSEVDRVLGDPALTIDDKMALIPIVLRRRIKIDIDEQANRIDELQQKAFQGAESPQSIDIETMKLKRMIDKRTQTYDLLRQIIDKYNQTANGIIDSIGR